MFIRRRVLFTQGNQESPGAKVCPSDARQGARLRRIMQTSLNGSVVVVCCLLAAACTRRPVADDSPRGVRGAALDGSGDQPMVTGVDLVFVIDDSISMADKQAALVQSLRRLSRIDSRCTPPVKNAPSAKSVDGSCPEGWYNAPLLPTARSAVVISTSLEAAGACATTSRGAHPIVAQNSAGYGHTPHAFLDDILEVGDAGCGFEAPLEAMYRFLVDPAPPLRVEVVEGEDGPQVQAHGLDEELLELRKKFLSPYSNVVVIILTDEDDCSVNEHKDAWKLGNPAPLARGSSTCDSEPTSPCCRSCDSVEELPPSGCTALSADPSCAASPTWEKADDPLNLRCFDQKRRFGSDFLFPISRYVNALSDPQIEDRSGNLVDNPLFAHGRTKDMVSVLLLAGTPWQLLRDETDRANEQLRLLPSTQYEYAQLWEKILGDPAQHIPPSDPHLLQSITPRAGLPGAADPLDPIHGHEVAWGKELDLQYSCIFDLPEEHNCDELDNCPCSDDSADRPICRDEAGRFDQIQRKAQAYPPTRLLQFTRALGARGMLGSVCPRTLDDQENQADLNYGYAAAMSLLAQGSYASYFWNLDCFTPSLPVDDQGLPKCGLIEIYPGRVTCEENGRIPADEKLIAPLREALAEVQATGQVSVGESTFCAIPPFAGDPSQETSPYFSCQNDLHPQLEGPGYCYIDRLQPGGSAKLLSGCIQPLARRIRVIPQVSPFSDAQRVVMCDYGKRNE